MTQPPHRLAVTALAACILGFVLSPLPFIALAARAELQPMATIILGSCFVLSSGFLLTRLLATPSTQTAGGIAIRLVELTSWAIVTSILVFISRMHLLRGIERWGTVNLVLLGASTLLFPLVWVRRTTIEQRVTRLPRAVVISALCTLLALSGTTMILYLTTPARFL